MICLRQIYPLSGCASRAPFFIICGASRHHNPRAEGASNLRTLRTLGPKARQPSRRRRVQRRQLRPFFIKLAASAATTTLGAKGPVKLKNPWAEGPSILRTFPFTTLGAKPRQPSRRRRVQWRSRIGGGERSEPIRRMSIMPYDTER